jgi:hypothetical protein
VESKWGRDREKGPGGRKKITVTEITDWKRILPFIFVMKDGNGYSPMNKKKTAEGKMKGLSGREAVFFWGKRGEDGSAWFCLFVSGEEGIRGQSRFSLAH